MQGLLPAYPPVTGGVVLYGSCSGSIILLVHVVRLKDGPLILVVSFGLLIRVGQTREGEGDPADADIEKENRAKETGIIAAEKGTPVFPKRSML